jgi:isocitrate/isopropylmalate dehydrogenase
MYKIGLIPGDGIGPEITREAMKVVGAAAEKN